MLRLIVRIDDGSMAVNLGGNVVVTYRTFDVDLPEVEALLRKSGGFCGVSLIGADLVGVDLIDTRPGHDR